jgi:hypothetical protein
LDQAVGLVDRHPFHSTGAEEGLDRWTRQPLGREKEHPQVAKPRPSDEVGSLGRRHPRVEGSRREAGLARPSNLVGHERHQRTHDQRQVGAQGGREQVGDALAPAGREKADRVTPTDKGANQRFLAGPKGGMPEMAE